MPEQESNPELQAAREDALKRFKEAVKELSGLQAIMQAYEYGQKKDEIERLGQECTKLGIAESDQEKVFADVFQPGTAR